MNEEINRNEERQESPRRRRRSELHSAPAEDTMGRTMEVRIPGKDALRKSADSRTSSDEPAVQGADSRIPPEARRMTASPYGASGDKTPKRPGTRPAKAARRPAEDRSYGSQNEATSRENRSFGAQSGNANRGTKIYGLPEDETDGTRAFDRKRISVGYAPGQMKIDPRRLREAGREVYGNCL